MSIEIRIGIADDNVSADTLDRHMQALGFTRHVEVRNVGYIGGDVGGVVAEARETEAAAGENVAKTEAPKATRTRKKADDKPTANISANPEDRKPPEDDEVTQAQDAADEQAEVESDPCAPPAAGAVVPGQGDGEHADPGGQPAGGA